MAQPQRRLTSRTWYVLAAIAMGLVGTFFTALLLRGGTASTLAGGVVGIAAIMAVVALVMLAIGALRRPLLTALASAGAAVALLVTPIAFAADNASEDATRDGAERTGQSEVQGGEHTHKDRERGSQDGDRGDQDRERGGQDRAGCEGKDRADKAAPGERPERGNGDRDHERPSPSSSPSPSESPTT